MSQSISSLPQKVQEAILGVTLSDDGLDHLPVPAFAADMQSKAAVLIEHAPIYKERVRWDALPLAGQIKEAVDALLVQDNIWQTGMYEHDKLARFWFDNKTKLYANNAELMGRLDFHFHLTNNKAAIAVLTQIGRSENDLDAVDDGRRLKFVLAEYQKDLEGGVLTAAEIEAFSSFYTEIEQARTAALVDRTAPHDDRILRDKIYTYIESLDETVMKAAKSVFANEKKQYDRYRSQYKLAKSRRYAARKKAEQADEVVQGS